MQILKTHHVGLAVQDTQRSLDFYCGCLGMKVLIQREITTPWVGTVNGLSGAHLKVTFLDAYGQHIELLEFVTPPHPQSNPKPANQPGTAHLTFIVDDLEAAYQELAGKGVRFISAPQTNTEGPNAGSQVVFLLDPDGFRIELVQQAPGQVQVP